jgi:methylated-DNA-[protein]-cysteine S-methyltransferase
MKTRKFPQGYIGLDFGKNGLRALSFGSKQSLVDGIIPKSASRPKADFWGAKQEVRLRRIMSQLRKYFCCERVDFKVKIDWSDIPKFTQKVLKATRTIPYGEVRSYSEIAAKIGKPKASRAVGQALARNPLPIVIPCHRVIKSDGTLGGFAWGKKWKQRLLEHEGFKVIKGKLSL